MIKLMEDIDLENYTLILPSVAIGNVGQLSVDLLISNLNLSKIGQIFDAAFVPIVGANAYYEHSSEIITAIDIYAGIKERIIAIQIRSPYVDELTDFFNEIAQFVTERKIAKVIILASSHDYEKKEIQPQHLKFRYVISPSMQTKIGKLFDDLNWIPHKPKIVSDMITEERLWIPGDNIEDAIALVHYLDQWIHVLETSINNLKYPPSWKHLFGKPPSQDLY